LPLLVTYDQLVTDEVVARLKGSGDLDSQAVAGPDQLLRSLETSLVDLEPLGGVGSGEGGTVAGALGHPDRERASVMRPRVPESRDGATGPRVVGDCSRSSRGVASHCGAVGLADGSQGGPWALAATDWRGLQSGSTRADTGTVGKMMG